jgi:DoxX-like protein
MVDTPATTAIHTGTSHAGTRPTTLARIGVVLSALPVLFLTFDAVIKLMLIDPVVTSMGELGYPVALARIIGALELACLLVYVVPRTSIVGAILLTGFLGGAIASHARIESPLFTHTLFGTYVGLMLWGGLILRHRTLRALIANSATGRDARWA